MYYYVLMKAVRTDKRNITFVGNTESTKRNITSSEKSVSPLKTGNLRFQETFLHALKILIVSSGK